MTDWCIIDAATGSWIRGPLAQKPATIAAGSQAMAVDPAFPDTKDWDPATKKFVTRYVAPIPLPRIRPAVKLEDEARSTTTLVDDTALVLPVAASAMYRLVLCLPIVTGGALTGFKYALTGPAGATLALNDGTGAGAVAALLAGLNKLIVPAGAYHPFAIGTLLTTSEGNLTLQWAPNGIGTATLKAGASLELLRLA